MTKKSKKAVEKLANALAWHAIPGALGAAAGATIDEDKKIRGALIGGASGVLTGHVSGKAIPKLLNKRTAKNLKSKLRDIETGGHAKAAPAWKQHSKDSYNAHRNFMEETYGKEVAKKFEQNSKGYSKKVDDLIEKHTRSGKLRKDALRMNKHQVTERALNAKVNKYPGLKDLSDRKFYNKSSDKAYKLYKDHFEAKPNDSSIINTLHNFNLDKAMDIVDDMDWKESAKFYKADVGENYKKYL